MTVPVVADRARAALRTSARSGWPPLAVMAGALVFVARCAGYGLRQVVDWQSWSRADSGHYAHIAADLGYTAQWHCGPPHISPTLPPGNYLCGTVGWFPGYPFLSRAVSELTAVPLRPAMMLVGWLAWYLMLLLVWRLLPGARGSATRWLCLVAAALVPGQIYFTALFPVALCAAGMLGALYFALSSGGRRAGAAAFGCAFVAGYSYITALVLVPALLLTAVLLVQGGRRARALAGAAGAAAGFGAVLLTMQLSVGIWDAYVISTRKFGVGAHDPLGYLRNRISYVWRELPPGLGYLRVLGGQTLLSLVIVVGCVLLVLARTAAGPSEPVPGGLLLGRVSRAVAARVSALDAAIALTAVGAWLVPYVAGGHASAYRSEAFVVLAVPLLRRLPWPVLVPLIAAEAWVAAHMIPLFVNHTLV